MKKRIIFIVFCILLCAFSTSCSKEKEKTLFSAYSFDSFDTVATIKGYAYTKEEFDAIADEAFALLREYHTLYTIYERYEGKTNLKSINDARDGAHQTLTVDARIIDMLTLAREMYELTNGECNIAMGSVLSIWHDHRTEASDNPMQASLPSMEKLQNASLHTDINNMIIDEEAGTVFLSDPKMTLDVGGIAKGYAVEMVARHLEEMGVDGYVINVGGNIRGVGTSKDWRVGIENPHDDEQTPYLAYLSIQNQSVVTSGSYQRYYVVDGKSYHHVIDRDTLMPSEHFSSVSIICQSSAMGDALSTALFCMELEEGRALISSLDDVEAMWVTPDGEVYYSDGFSKYEN